ncbi:hypothetical protein AQJ46_48005 [Streptomyces canus]|uniref:Uncharacterized protein n=1 Tax=Streptomyces canus TaxID=58343 RepID=A0A101RKK8_9ACTN|nr:hypothetical protein AQJ46_48005 [Streptomyces canus]
MVLSGCAVRLRLSDLLVRRTGCRTAQALPRPLAATVCALVCRSVAVGQQDLAVVVGRGLVAARMRGFHLRAGWSVVGPTTDPTMDFVSAS